MIPCSDPLAQYNAYQSEIDSAINKVLSSGRYILGEEVKAFEREFAQYLGVNHCIGVGSGTEALHIALTACGVRQGDEVITVSHTAVATATAIKLCGAKPVFVDIDASTYTMDVDCLQDAISENSKAIVPVHLYGHPADISGIAHFAKANSLYLIEDCAQAHGAAYNNQIVGSFGDLSCFSFYPTKNLGCIGDGGAIACQNPELAKQALLIREYGWEEKFVSSRQGWNSRLDELQAAILRIKLTHLDESNALRCALAQQYHEHLDKTELVLPTTLDHYHHVFHLFVVRTPKRDQLKEFLNRCDIGASIHYPVPIHRQPEFSTPKISLPETEKACQEILSLPLFPELSTKIERVIESILEFEGQHS